MTRKRHRYGTRLTVAITAAALLCTLAALAPATAGTGAGGKVVVLVVDRIGVNDITASATPYLWWLASRWSAGLMVTHTAERENGKERDLGADYVTLGAGARMRGSATAALSFDAGEVIAGDGAATTAGSYYRQLSGTAVPAGGVACLGFPDILRSNVETGTDSNAGLLGKLLAEAGRTAAVAGNQDDDAGAVRFAPLVASRPDGIVPAGRLAGLTVPAPSEPGGMRTDMAGLLEASRRFLPSCDLLVIDTGDTGRVDRQWADTRQSVLDAARRRALQRVDDFASRIGGQLDLDTSLLLVVSPGAPMKNRLSGDYSTPFIAAGKGFGKGLLTSGSTRQTGLVNNTDFLPTVLGRFGIGVGGEVIGSDMRTGGPAPGGQASLSYLKDIDRQFGVTRKARWPIVLGFLLLVVVFLLLSLACLPRVARSLGSGGWREPLRRALRPVSVVVLAAPVSFLLVSAISYNGVLLPLTFCLGYALVVGLGAYFLTRKSRRLDPVTLVCLFSAGVMLVDLLIGGKLLFFPLLGSSSLDGMRFFGQSNAVSGMFIAYAVWAGAGLIGDRAEVRGASWLSLAGLAVISFALGFGTMGADFGGFIAAAATALVFFFALRGSLGGWRVGAIVGGAAAATGFMVLLDSLFVHTHAGHAIAAGSSKFYPLLGRKLLILFSQIKSVLFLAILMITVVIALALWMKRPDSFWSRRWASDRAWTAALFSLAVGSVVALVFNDTGIAMMGSMVMITIPVATYHFTGRIPEKESREAGTEAAR
ncbi:MAG TPA: hypothetical protein VIK15_00625 [Candidatus Anoxymicrobiaceae bacterium]